MNGGVFRYNRAWDYNDEGLFFTGWDGPVSGVKVYGNIFYGTGSEINPRGIEIRQDYDYSGIEIYNNTFVNLGVGGILNRAPETGHSCANCIAKNNLSYKAANQLADMSASHNIADGINRFVGLGSADYRLAAPVAGLALPNEFNQDLAGALRGADGVWDIGAYEFQGGSVPSPCDVNGDGTTTVADVQAAVNQVLGVTPCGTADINGNNRCDVVDVQRVVNAALGGLCVSP